MRSFDLALASLAFLFSAALVGCADDQPTTTEGQGSSSSSGASSGSTGSASTDATTSTGSASESTTTPTTTAPTSTSGPTTDATATTDATSTTDVTATGGSSSGSTTGGEATCCQAGVDPLCGDAAIEACVCAVDPLCCEQAWDDTCVGEVVKLGCGECPAPVGDCCEDGQGPGCLDDAVAACVCGQLPQCCDTLWGPECVAAVDQLGCGVCQAKGACCEAHMGSGCVDAGVEACVCGQLPQCCQGDWTAECVAAVEQGGCGTCSQGGMCCAPQDTPGCGDQAIEACVCGQDPFCCNSLWDDQCVAEVEQLGCAMCGGNVDACCTAGMGPGCGDAAVEACVCAVAPSCCQTLWSDACAALVEPLGCGMCGGGGTGCCEAHDTPSCDDQAIADCVCAQDDFCCASAWDGLCVAEVDQLGCGVCM